MDRVRVLIADDHANVRSQLKVRLEREQQLEIVGEAGSSSQAVECVQTREPHVLLIDPVMHDGLGMEAIRQLTERHPGLAIVVLTAAADTALTMDLRKAGVKHILNKNIATHELLQTLAQVKFEIERQSH